MGVPGTKRTFVLNLIQIGSMVKENEHADRRTDGHDGPKMVANM